MPNEHAFLLQRVQPAMVGLVDGSLATLAPIFAIALATHNPRYAFIAGLATALGGGREHGLLRGPLGHGRADRPRHPAVRGSITGAGTFLGGILHTLPFLIPHYHVALIAAVVVVGIELVGLAFLRWRFFAGTSSARSRIVLAA